MKRAALAAAALVSFPATGAEPPLVVGTIANRAGGQITLTSRQGSCKDNEFTAYIVDDGGQVALWGCWIWLDTQIFVTYSDKTSYTYHILKVQISEEYKSWANQKGKSEIM